MDNLSFVADCHVRKQLPDAFNPVCCRILSCRGYIPSLPVVHIETPYSRRISAVRQADFQPPKLQPDKIKQDRLDRELDGVTIRRGAAIVQKA